MDATQAADTMLDRGKTPEMKTLLHGKKEVQFPKDQAERMLAYQKQTGFDDFSDPDELTSDAPNGQPSDSVDSNAGKSKSPKAGAA